MSSEDMLVTETGRNKAGGGSARNLMSRPGPKTGRRARETAPPPAAGGKDMSMKFDIQPASNPTPEKDRVAKLVDPGF